MEFRKNYRGGVYHLCKIDVKVGELRYRNKEHKRDSSICNQHALHSGYLAVSIKSLSPLAKNVRLLKRPYDRDNGRQELNMRETIFISIPLCDLCSIDGGKMWCVLVDGR